MLQGSTGMKILTLLMVMVGVYALHGQVQFVQRLEFETKWEDDNFIVFNREEGIIAFRMASEDAFNREKTLQYFTADFQLRSSGIKKMPVESLYNLLGFDLDGDLLYVLFQKGEAPSGDKYITEINLNTGGMRKIPLNVVLGMELREFFVLNKQVILMGNVDNRPVIQ